MATIAEELTELLAQLPLSEQERVLSFARALAHVATTPHTTLPPGTPGIVIAQMRVDPETAKAMEEAHEDCEQIWPDEDLTWDRPDA